VLDKTRAEAVGWFRSWAMDTRRPDANGTIDLSTQNDNDLLNQGEPLLASQAPAMIALLENARRAANGDATILLTGESGTGKDALARQIHRWSSRSSRPLVRVNCATLSEQLLENELFGHVRGAFTGAVKDKQGRLETAEGSTVLFNEIAEISLSLQTKFIRFVEERRFERIGSCRTIEVDVRIIAASNRSLPAEVAAGRLREDLYYRLNVIWFTLPPLRERRSDILVLTEWMLKQAALRAGRPTPTLASEAAEALLRYPWPGNVRELRNAMEHAAVLSKGNTIRFDDLPELVRHPFFGRHVSEAHGTTLQDFEREHILRALAENATIGKAADALGINTSTLWRKRKRYGIA
jgi:two-component system, NtrC family, response regulator AlgB